MNKNIKKYPFKSGLPQEFEVISIGELYRDFTDVITAIHRTEFYHIIWFQKGSPIHLVDFEPIEIKPNTILFLNKDIVQRFDKQGDYDGKAILFTDAFFCKTELDVKYLRSSILFNDLLSVSHIQLQANTSLFADLFQLIEAELKRDKDVAQSDILKNYLHNFLLLAERERRKQDFTEVKKGADLDYLMLFKDLLDAKYRQFKQVGHYANQLSVTEKRLNQATSKILDKSPKQMIDDRVMLEAKRLLAHTNESVKEIGFSLGFDEPTNFIKFFRKHNHATPMEFRERYASD
jgi:AraC family transcriptional regulator, transcriptional activator of pobA